jgi:molybdopterin synthase catalytic subunit
VVRDHSEGRPDVTSLTYEAYEDQAMVKMGEVAAEARRRWPMIERVALLHRVGELQLTEASVIVVVSSPHRPHAFEAARFCIDTLKETVPIWKAEEWSEGKDWALGEHTIRPVSGN